MSSGSSRALPFSPAFGERVGLLLYFFRALTKSRNSLRNSSTRSWSGYSVRKSGYFGSKCPTSSGFVGTFRDIIGIGQGHGLGPPLGSPTFGGSASPFLISSGPSHLAFTRPVIAGLPDHSSSLHHSVEMNSP